MKLIIPCRQCDVFTPNKIEFNDDGTYHLNCEKGHKSVVFLQEQQFELLFEMGMMALLDGYTREAVSSLAASVERFHEFCIRMMLAENEIDGSQVEQGWKLLSKQSERQLGAFYFLYLNQFKTMPLTIKSKWIEFRNDVIHKGHFAKEEKVMEYAKDLFEYMMEILKIFREKCWEGVVTVVARNQSKYYSKHPSHVDEKIVITMRSMFGLSLTDELFGKDTFEDALAHLKTKIHRAYSKL